MIFLKIKNKIEQNYCENSDNASICIEFYYKFVGRLIMCEKGFGLYNSIFVFLRLVQEIGFDEMIENRAFVYDFGHFDSKL